VGMMRVNGRPSFFGIGGGYWIIIWMKMVHGKRPRIVEATDLFLSELTIREHNENTDINTSN